MRAGAVFSFSDSFSRPGVVAVVTATRHLPVGVELVVASTGLSAEVEAVLAQQAAVNERRLSFISTQRWVESLPSATRYVADTWARVFIAEMLPTFGRVVYLDADTVTIDSLSPLFEMPIGRSVLAALPDPTFPTFGARGVDYTVASGRPAATPYFNSGVLVIDPAGWTAVDVAARARIVLREGRLPLDYVDQDVLNVVLAGHWRPLEPRYHHLVEGSVVPPEAAVVHFTGPDKPWEEADPASARLVAYRAAAAAGGWGTGG